MTEISEEAKALTTAMNYGWPEQIQDFLDAHDKRLMEVAEKLARALKPLSSSLDEQPGASVFSAYVASICEIETASETMKEFESFKKGKQP